MARGIWIRPPRGPGKPEEVWIVYKNGASRRKRERLGPNNPEMRRLAKDVLAKRQAQVIEGRFFPERQTKARTFRELAQKYQDLLGPQRCRAAFFIGRKLLATFGDRRACDIMTADLQAYYNRKAAENCYSTANRHLSLIRSIYNRATDWGDFHSENPARKVKRKPDNPHRERYLSPEEMGRFLEVCEAELYPLVICALTTGMRKAEMLGLQWENVDLERDVIHVLKTKSGHPRQIPIVSKLREVLMSLGPKREGSVFGLTESTFRRRFASARKASGLPHFRWHDLRHTFASTFVMKTHDLPALQKILGHSTPDMVLRYAHHAKGHLAVGMELVGAVLPTLRELDAPSEVGHHPGHQESAAAQAPMSGEQKSLINSPQETISGV